MSKEFQAMLNRNYLCVFHAGWIDNELKDISDDPCFDEIPTWGICRPLSRKSIKVGDRLFFLGYVRDESKYYIKGWFEVGEKISYSDALARFPNRRNVIISKQQGERAYKWRYVEQKKYFEKSGHQNLDFLKVINTQEGTFFQNPTDEHEIDNWKCRRIFHCQTKRFRNCVDIGGCYLDGVSLGGYSNYIVANPKQWGEYGRLKIDFSEVRELIVFHKSLKTPMGQHNILKLTDIEMGTIITYLKDRKI